MVLSGSPGLYREKRERAMKSANARRTRDERLGGGVGRSRSANPARDAFPEPPRSAIVPVLVLVPIQVPVLELVLLQVLALVPVPVLALVLYCAQ